MATGPLPRGHRLRRGRLGTAAPRNERLAHRTRREPTRPAGSTGPGSKRSMTCPTSHRLGNDIGSGHPLLYGHRGAPFLIDSWCNRRVWTPRWPEKPLPAYPPPLHHFYRHDRHASADPVLVVPGRYSGIVKHSVLSTTPTAETPALSDEERAERRRRRAGGVFRPEGV